MEFFFNYLFIKKKIIVPIVAIISIGISCIGIFLLGFAWVYILNKISLILVLLFGVPLLLLSIFGSIMAFVTFVFIQLYCIGQSLIFIGEFIIKKITNRANINKKISFKDYFELNDNYAESLELGVIVGGLLSIPLLIILIPNTINIISWLFSFYDYLQM